MLVTGLGGLIGGAVRRHLAGRHELRGLGRRPVAGWPVHLADVADLEAIAPAFAGVDAVVHLAADTRTNPPFDVLLATNLVGTYNVFEAARRAGVRRVVYASSGAVVSGWEQEEPYRSLVEGRYDLVAGGWPRLTHEAPLRPTGLYGAGKVWGEALGRVYAEAHGLSVLCLRIGRVHAEDRPLSARDFSVWCSQRDVARMIGLALEAPAGLRFDVVYALSDNRWSYRDLDHARQVLGFVPLDRAEDHR